MRWLHLAEDSRRYWVQKLGDFDRKLVLIVMEAIFQLGIVNVVAVSES